MLHEIIKIEIKLSKSIKSCKSIGEYCAPKIVFGPGKLSGVSRNGPQSLPSCCFLRQETELHIVSLRPAV